MPDRFIMDNTSEADREFGTSDTILPLMRYHLLMMFCTMFATMTVVNWEYNLMRSEVTSAKDFGTGWQVVWVKTSSQWMTILLYVWTIVAPRVLALCGVEREFDLR